MNQQPHQKKRFIFSGLLPLGLALLLSSPLRSASGSTIDWNPGQSGGPVVDGAGTWDNSTLNWLNGSTQQAWPGADTGDTAVFGGGTAGTAGTVYVSGSQSMAALTFNTPFAGNYTLVGAPTTSGTLVVGITGNGIITINGGSPTIDVPIANVASAGRQIDINLNNSANFTLGASSAITTAYADNGLLIGGASTGTITLDNISFSTKSGNNVYGLVFNRSAMLTGTDSDSSITQVANSSIVSVASGAIYTGTGLIEIGTTAGVGVVGTLDISGSVGAAGGVYVGQANVSGANVSSGNLIVESSGTLTNPGVMNIAYGSISSGTANIYGVLSQTGAVTIGYSGTGTGLLNITGSANLSSSTLVLGNNTSSVGNLTVGTTGTLTNSDAVTSANGTLSTSTINVNGVFNQTSGGITLGQTGYGVMNVSGTLNDATALSVAYKGSGLLTINATGTASMLGLSIATGSVTPVASGTANINGMATVGASGISDGSLGIGVINVSGTLADLGAMNLASTGTGTVTINSGGLLTNTGYVALGFGAGGFGTLNVSGSFTNASTLQLGNGASSAGIVNINSGGVINSTGALTVGNSAATSSGTFTDAGTLAETAGIAVDGNGLFSVSSGGVATAAGLTIGNSATLPGTVNISGSMGVTSVTVGSSGIGSMTVGSTGTMSDSGNFLLANGASYTGTANINGVFNENSTSATAITIGQAGYAVLNVSGTLNDLGGIAVDYTGKGVFNLNSGGTITTGAGGAFQITQGQTTSSGTANLAGTANLNGDLVVSNGGVGVLNMTSGTTTVTSGRYFYINQANATNGSSGIANISGGTLVVNGVVFGSANTSAGTNTAILNLTGGTIVMTGNAGFHTGGYAQTGGGPTASNTQLNLGGGTVLGNTAWGDTMNTTLTGINGNVTFQTASLVGGTTENITLSGTLSGAGGFTETGGGTLTLGAVGSTNSYTGATVIAAGTLSGVVSGAIASSTNIDVQSGATLDLSGAGVGTYNEPTTQTIMGGGTITGGTTAINIAGTLRPHDTPNGIATMNVTSTTGTLTLQNGSTFALNIGSTTGDEVNSNGAVDLGVTGGDTINLTINLTAQPTNGMVYTILNGSTLTNTGLFSYAGSSLANGALFWVNSNGDSEEFQIDYGSTSDTLLAVVPEPGTWAMMASGLGLLLCAQRMKRRARM